MEFLFSSGAMSNSQSSSVPSTPSSIEKLDFPCIDERDCCPDGGRKAWFVVLGGFLAQCSTWGIMMSFNVFKDYYLSTLLAQSSTPVISAIGSLQLFLAYGLGPVVGRAFDAYGIRVLYPLGSSLAVLGLLLTSFCQENQPWQIFLTHGVMFGIGTSIMTTPPLALCNHWFDRKRPLALGIVVSGTGMGGAVFPPLLLKLIEVLGFRWAVRVCALISTVCLGLNWWLATARLPPIGGMSLKSAVDFNGFRDCRYALAATASCLMAYALYIPYFFIGDYADLYDVPQNIVDLLVPLTNFCGFVSRIAPAFIATIVGPLDVLLASSWGSAILVLGMWLPSHTAAPIAVFGGLYGFFSGPFTSIMPSYVANITPQEHYGARLGMIDFFIAVATLVGPPTQGALIDPKDEDHFQHLIIFTGSTIAASGIVLVITRLVDSRQSKSRINQ
ncbi:hypothetical protein HGRIS_005094 [Hohenbuehelia grisea]|uniref:Major facilitator superfamily (MFS) profile domain-containing protein n=1 Tax=Hohenbuehelia grisea TaxID=104357 RepID=A0ABR3JDZ1_9AGAR